MNSLAIMTKEKAHTATDGMDFLKLLANYPTATTDNLENSKHTQTLNNLSVLLTDDKLKFINSNIDVDGQPKQTANSIATVLYNQHYQPSNLAIFPLDNTEPFLLHDFKNDGFIFGNGEQVLIINDLTIAMIIAIYTKTRGEDYTVIAPLDKGQFYNLVKAHAKQSQVMIITDYEQGLEYERTFKGDNVKLAKVVDILEDLIVTHSINDILALSDTKVIELNGIEWGEPEPLEDTNTPATRYPIEAWQGVLRQAIEAIAYHAQVPTAMAGQCILGALSTIGQRYINAPIGHTHKPVSLFLITEGGSGSGKTFASELSHYSINKWDERIYKTYIELLNEWKSEVDSLKGKERKEYLQSNAKPSNDSMLIQEGTIEAILDQFILDDKANLSWTTDDAGQFFNGHTMKGDTAGNAIASLAKLWDGSPVSRVRSQRGANPQFKTNAYDVRLTLDLQGQRIILEPALTDPMLVQQGFLARALLACPDSLQGQRVWNTPERLDNNPHDDPRLQAYWTRCDILLDPLPTEITKDLTGKEIRLNMPFENRQARQALADFQQRVENRQAKGNAYEFLKAFASRMAQNASRIASLMAFFDCQKSVTVEYLERAFMLVEYSTAERLRYLDIKTNEKSDTQKLIDWLVDRASKDRLFKLNRTYVANSCPMPMQRSNKLLQQELDKLEQAGYIRQEQEGKKRVILINPCLFK